MVRLYIADDHALFREGLVRIFDLEDDIEVVGQATDGEQAIQHVIEIQPDVVLMDINMPKVTGVEATKKIKKLLPDVKIIILSIHDDESYIFETIRAGASGYLLKDVEGRVLVDAINHVANGGSFIHPRVTSKVLKEFTRLSEEAEHMQVHSQSDEGANQQVWDEMLTSREQEILTLMARGMSNRDVSEELFISEKTVKNHVSNIFQKMQVRDRTQAVIEAIKNGWVKL
ncbi:response regulator transcription factor [Desulfuribacillus alkaliarsenatis]|uniref:DNA-binding response regulator n=1 Tax=Desulfuribacillus alkaliarsenatis TaxID=766136 RepID=A0A1E5G3U8_9FIRM|nr:response regulator transcription factor [Desulfuribacillus alkaliarsenatis]OEF97699.1 DNA-binding response regulator [Desulfuribacillus alkaliarsenatis]